MARPVEEQRRTRAADALIAGLTSPAPNTRGVRRALAALFGGAAGKDVARRARRKVQGDREAWRSVLDDLSRRGLRGPERLVVDGGAGLEAALAALWGDVPTQRCTVHKPRKLLANVQPRRSRRSRLRLHDIAGDGGVAQPPLALELPAPL
jgi:Transposase, Mutator family